MPSINKIRSTFYRFYSALPITGPRLIKDKNLKSIYKYIYKGNTHNLSFGSKIGVGIIHAPLSIYKGLKECLQLLKENGNFVRENSRISKIAQFKELLSLTFIKKTHPGYYYTKKAYAKNKLKLSENYLINEHFIAIHSRLLARTKSRSIINDKIKFYQHCQKYKDDLLTIIGIAKDEKFYFLSEENKIPDSNLFIKPSEGNGGRNCHAISYNGSGYEFNLVKKPIGKAILIKILTIKSKREPYLLQYQYRNCKEMEDLSSGALITSRVTSYVDPEGNVKFFFSCLMMPTGNIVVSNGIHGGILAKINFDTGTIGPAYRLEDEDTEIHNHPNTGAKITGFKLPYWEKVIETCKKFHSLFTDIPSIGWDVCFTDEGPKIIEGNLSWPIEIWQLTDKDFDPSEYLEVMNHYISKFES